MSLPWISRKEHRRRFTELSQTYRGDIESLQRRLKSAEDRLVQNAIKDVIAFQDLVFGSTFKVVLTLDPYELQKLTSLEISEKVMEHISRKLTGLHNDYRGDLREDPSKRLLRLS